MLCGEDLELQLLVLDRVLKATTKKVVNFFEKKVHPRQNPGYAYVISHRAAAAPGPKVHRECPIHVCPSSQQILATPLGWCLVGATSFIEILGQPAHALDRNRRF